MTRDIKLISTDFDGTLFAEFENPPIPVRLQQLLAQLQSRGAKWVVNTGRDMSGLMEALGRANASVQPDFIVLVEREIYVRDGAKFVPHASWNDKCTRLHQELFERIRPDVPRLADWITSRFKATVYQDPYSPLCLLAGNNGDADQIYEFLDQYARTVPGLTVVRNDVYARFSHEAFSKGTALAEIARLLGLRPEQVFAVGDHLNDLPMLKLEHARWLAAPANAIAQVKQAVAAQNGYIASMPHGNGVAEALEFYLDAHGRLQSTS
ncbi:MAG: HAD hydrolase family protein [Verrucomicrobiae bacterium]|nr:HAD hydrolase family protein [Verrucomicrobiae bacterium]